MTTLSYLCISVRSLYEGHAGQWQVVLALLVTEGATVGALEHALAEADPLAALNTEREHKM